MGRCVGGLLGLLSLMMFPRRGLLQGLTVEPSWTTFFTGEFANLTCDIGGGRVTEYFSLYKDKQLVLDEYSRVKVFNVQLQSTDQSGTYQCTVYESNSGTREYSNGISLIVSDANVILQHPMAILYQGETVPLRCRHRHRVTLTTAAFYKDGSLIVTDPGQTRLVASENAAEISTQLLSDSSYTCKLNRDQESQPMRPILQRDRPVAQLIKHEAPEGGGVTLTCSVTTPGWKFFWYRGRKTGDSLTKKDATFLSSDRISTSQPGVYWCRGGRGNPVYYTEYSSPIVTSRAVVVLQPQWPEVYYSEALTLRCRIEGGEDVEWEYEWMVPKVHSTYLWSKDECRIPYATGQHNGSYACLGRMKNERSTTMWSNAFSLSVSPRKPVPVLTVSPSWPSPGDSVTLNCTVAHPRVGWRFYWYKAIPDSSINFYRMELLPSSTNGTKQSRFTVHGQTETAGYSCKAGRGSPVSFTHSSHIKFVWSGDLSSAASISVSPDQAQHFITATTSLSLSCSGNSSTWTIKRFSPFGYLTNCASWGSKTGHTCNLTGTQITDGVYWCETPAGRFSNGVNITGSYEEAIVVFPAHPVTEGQPVTLRCQLKTRSNPSVVYFYKNGRIVHNDTRGELFIPAVSQSDQGFYKCAREGSMRRTSTRALPESWMSVKAPAQRPPSSPFPVSLTAGLVCGVTLVFLLLLFLSLYAKSKKSHTARFTKSDQSAATGDTIDLEDKPPPRNGDCSEVTYSMIVIKSACVSAEEGKLSEDGPNPEESAVYSNLLIKPTAGKSEPAEEDQIVYSEVRMNL